MALSLLFERFSRLFWKILTAWVGFRFFMEISGIWPIGIFLQHCGMKRSEKGRTKENVKSVLSERHFRWFLWGGGRKDLFSDAPVSISLEILFHPFHFGTEP